MLDINEVTQGAITAALWSDCESLDYDPETGERGGLEYLDLDTESTAKVRAYVEKIVGAIPDEVLEYYVDERAYASDHGSISEYFGYDLYMCGAGHGVGFFDLYELGPVAGYLQVRARELAGGFEHAHFYQTDEDTAAVDGLY